MIVIYPPSDFVEVSVDDFEAFLKTCNDYVRTSNAAVSDYRFKHNGELFAVAEVKDKVESVFVNPKLLNKQ